MCEGLQDHGHLLPAKVPQRKGILMAPRPAAGSNGAVLTTGQRLQTYSYSMLQHESFSLATRRAWRQGLSDASTASPNSEITCHSLERKAAKLGRSCLRAEGIALASTAA